MNRASIVIALVAAFVGLAAANPGKIHQGDFQGYGQQYWEQDDVELEPAHLSHHGYYRAPVSDYSDDLSFEELRLRQHGLGRHSGYSSGGYSGYNTGIGSYGSPAIYSPVHGSGYQSGLVNRHGLVGHRGVVGGGSHGLRKGGLRRPRRQQALRQGKSQGFNQGFGHRVGNGLGHGHAVGGVGSVGAIGAVGGLEHSRNSHAALGSSNHVGSHGLAEHSRGSLVAGGNNFDVGHHDSAHEDNEGTNKHQVINKEKTIIKDRTTGVNDVDSFHNSNGHSEGAHLSAGSNHLAAEGSNDRLEGSQDFDNEFNVSADSNSDLKANGGVGAIRGTGAFGQI